MDVQIVKLDPACTQSREDWRSYLQYAPGASIYHSLGWMDAIRETYPHRPHYLMAYRRSEVVGVFPLFQIRSFLAGTMLVSVPYAVYGGVVADDFDVAQTLLEEVESVARSVGARYVDIRSRCAVWSKLATVDSYATFTKTLPDRVDDVLTTLPRKARAEARRARNRFGLRVRFGDAQLKTVWKLYSQSMRRLGSPNFPHRFFRALLKATPEKHLVSVIYHEDVPVAGLLSFMHRTTVLPYYSGCDDSAANKMGANNYLYLTLMEKAVELGLSEFDFGRTRVDNVGSFNFKKNQGFEPTPLGYQYFLPNGGKAPNLTPSNRKFALARRVWQRLPLAITRPLGSWLTASIPG